jgi:hypothetical protein
MPKSRCVCGYEVDAATPAPVPGTARDARPKPGDLTVRLRCGRAWQFDVEGKLAPIDVMKLSPEDLANVRRVQAAIVRTQRLPS